MILPSRYRVTNGYVITDNGYQGFNDNHIENGFHVNTWESGYVSFTLELDPSLLIGPYKIIFNPSPLSGYDRILSFNISPARNFSVSVKDKDNTFVTIDGYRNGILEKSISIFGTPTAKQLESLIGLDLKIRLDIPEGYTYQISGSNFTIYEDYISINESGDVQIIITVSGESNLEWGQYDHYIYDENEESKLKEVSN